MTVSMSKRLAIHGVITELDPVIHSAFADSAA
jgi:hypothetical protein